MLHESFIAASSAPPKLTSSNANLLKDAGVFLHSYQPQPGLRNTFKKSVTAPNCIAISASHVFAAQSDKAVIHVYNRDKGNHEATVPFPERICSLILAAEDTIVVLGTEEGNIYLWETCTGRQLSAPQSHLQAVTTLAAEGLHLLSGSEDTTVLVWSLLDLLSFRPSSALAQHETVAPRHTLSAHQSAITSIAAGRSATSSNIAITASKDQTAIVWEYTSGTRLRTILLPSIPLSLALDPAERGFYTGFDDGSIQLVDFYPSVAVPISIRDLNDAATPIEPPAASRWTPPNNEVGAAQSISLSYDTRILISGHTSGKIMSWDTATGSFIATIADYPGSSITHLQFLYPSGFPNERRPRLRVVNIVKPKPHESFSSLKGQLSEAYTFNVQFSDTIFDELDSSDFLEALTAPMVPDSLIEACIAELAAPAVSTISIAPAPDHISLNVDGATDSSSAEELVQLRKQVEHLKKLQTASASQLVKLTHETVTLRKKEQDHELRRRRKEARRLQKLNAEWEAMEVNGNEAKARCTAAVVNGKADEDTLSETTSPTADELSGED